MEWKIVVDSCCDVTPELFENETILSVPLTITLGDKSISDDDSLDITQLLQDMKNCKCKIGSAAPSPALYKDAFVKSPKSFAVTLSSNLSASYSSACVGMEMARDEGSDVHVFDSKSASAGEVLIALKIRKMLRDGIHKSIIISEINDFIKRMKTYFVLENVDNLSKNGRIGKITGKIITILNIRPIMGSDGDGNIALFSHARSQAQIIERLVATIKQSGRNMQDEYMVIAHCNNHKLAEKLKNAVLKSYHFKDILIVPTKGISSVYANDGGLVMAY